MTTVFKTIFKRYTPYLLIAVLAFSLWHSHQDSQKYHKQSEELENTINELNGKIKHTQIRLNDSIELYQAEVSTLKMTQANIQARYDKLLKASKVKPKDVNSITDISSVVHAVDSGTATVNEFGGLHAELKDPFISIDVEIFPNKNTIIEYEMYDSLTVIDVQKKHSWLFGLIKWKEHKGVRVINHNPKATIRHLRTIEQIE